jgi:hypothetical protein
MTDNMPKKITEFCYRGMPLELYQSTYMNGRLALFLEAPGHELFATLTVNLPDEHLDEGEFFVKTWSENRPLAVFALSSGLFEDTGRRVQSGLVQVPVWRFTEGVYGKATSHRLQTENE